MNRESAKYYLKYVVLTLCFLVILVGLQRVWQKGFFSPEQPKAEQGVLDFRGWNFEQSHSLVLDGKWDFYPSKWMTSGDILSRSGRNEQTIQVPGNWTQATGSSYGYGTYVLRIRIDQPMEQPYVFWFHQIQASSEIEVNGKVLYTMGQLAAVKEQYRPESVPFTVSYDAGNEDEIILIIRTANFDHGTKSGISYSIRFGAEAAIDRERRLSVGFQLGTIIIFLLHAVYAGILLIMSRQRTLWIFILLLLCTALSVAADNDAILMNVLPLNYTWGIKIKLLSYLWLVFSMLLLTYRFNTPKVTALSFRIYVTILTTYSIYMLFFPVKDILNHAYWMFGGLYNLPAVWMFMLYGKMVYQRKKDTGFLLFAASAIISGLIWGAVVNNGEKNLPFYPIDILSAIVGFSAYWFKQFVRRSNENQELTHKLLIDHQQKDKFLVHTSRALKKPLDTILQLAHSQSAASTQAADSPSHKNIELLIKIGNRMSLLLGDLLDAPVLGEKGIQLNFKDVELRKVITDVLNMLIYLMEGKPLQLRINISSKLSHVYADEKRLSQILFNLLHNAIKYTEQGEIIIEASTVGDRVKVSITDTGIGMDDEATARIFNPYEQGQQNIEGGMGLGLSISRRLAELHHGELTVVSRLNEGSAFSFTLPSSQHQMRLIPEDSQMHTGHYPAGRVKDQRRNISEDKGSANKVHAESSGPLYEMARPNILIVDDDPVNLKVLANILSEENYRLTAVSSAHEALEQIRSASWDLLIADVTMPQMSGHELTKRVRQHFDITELPILLLITHSISEESYTEFLHGANDYVTKPVERLELKYRVQALISLKQSIDQSLRMETAYLQAQIKPHFLFNTINSIMALSEFDMEQMRNVAGAFADYLRYSVDFINTNQLVDLENEISLVKSYLFIEQVRFGDRLTVVWEIQPALRFKLPPLSIQPLVENAVRHGLLSRAKGGELVVRIYQAEAGACVEIIDNGKGIPAAQIENLLSLTRHNTGGIGLRNTNRRLIQRYGQGLLIQSEPGRGTTVSFMIPHDNHPVA